MTELIYMADVIFEYVIVMEFFPAATNLNASLHPLTNLIASSVIVSFSLFKF